MRRSGRIRMAMLLLVAAAACSRNPGDERGVRVEGPVPPAASSLPQAIDHHGATSSDAGASSKPQPERSSQAQSGAKALLQPAPGSQLQGDATLHETGAAVELVLQVKRATPGTGRVVLRGSGRCAEDSATDSQPAATGVPSETALGTLLVRENGEGRLELTLKDANLDTEREGTLLGKALVVYSAQPRKRARASAELPVACAQIQRD
jgi:hypothetical protein